MMYAISPGIGPRQHTRDYHLTNSIFRFSGGNYTDKKLEDESDSDWDDMTTQPIVEPSASSEHSKVTKVSRSEQFQKNGTDKIDLSDQAQPHLTKDVIIQPKQVGVSLGISRTLPKLNNSVPTPPLSDKFRQGRRRQERSMDPPYEFRTLTDESDKYSLSKAVSAPLKYTRNFQTEQVVDKARNYVTKRNSWDEVSELPEDNSPTLAGPAVLRNTHLGDKTIHVQNNPSLFKHDQHDSLESNSTPANDADTFTVSEAIKLSPDTDRMNFYVLRNGDIPEIATRSLSPATHLPQHPDTPHFNSNKINDGIYIFEEMSRDHVEYEKDLQEVYMMNFALRFERKIQRFWQEVFGCLRLFTSFFAFFFLECLRFFLRHLFQKLCIGMLILFADHLWKPLLQCCYNGCLMPGCVLCANLASSLVQVLKPLLGCFYSILREMGRCCRSVRLCESAYPTLSDYTRDNAHVI